MRLRWKITIAALALFAFGLAAMWQINGAIINRGFGDTEAAAAAGDGRRVADGVGAMLDTLGQLTRLQAVWDDPYQAALDRDGAKFLEDYPPADMWEAYRVDQLVVVDPEGRYIAGGVTRDHTDEFGPLPASLSPEVLATFVTPGNGAACGLWRFETAVSAFCTHALLRVDGTGDPAGYLTMFQPLDGVGIERIATRLGLTVSIDDGAASGTGAVDQQSFGIPQVEMVDAKTMQVRTRLDVKNDTAGLVLAATVDRSVHAQAATTEGRVLLASALLWAALLGALVLTVEVVFLRRTRAMSAALAPTGIEGELPARLASAGLDELDEVADAINHTLDTLAERERHITEERVAAQAARDAAEAARLAAIDARVEAQALRAAAAGPGTANRSERSGRR